MSLASRFRETYTYKPDTGLLIRKIASNRWPVGHVAGHKHHSGYMTLRFEGKLYQAHRLVWLWMTGKFPKAGLEIDHIDRDRSNNRWANLRIVTPQINCCNQAVRKTNKLGVKGVSFHKASGKYVAQVCRNYKVIHLGCFNTVEEARDAYTKFKEFTW